MRYLLIFATLATMMAIFEGGLILGLANPEVRVRIHAGPFAPVEVRGVTTEEIFRSDAYIQNYSVAMNLVQDYEVTHRKGYILDVYDCTDMASDLWDELHSLGMNAVLIVGNRFRDVQTFNDIDHAWVLVEVAPGGWLALDPVTGSGILETSEMGGGITVQSPRWYRGAIFDNPRDLRNYVTI